MKQPPLVKMHSPAFVSSWFSGRGRRVWICISGLAVVGVIMIVAPGPVGGCYWEYGGYFNSTSGHSFTYLADGRVYSCNEYSDRMRELGTYEHQKGVGWVLTLRKSQRRALMTPHLLFMKFSDIDAGEIAVTAPFQWRDPFVWKTSATLRRVTGGTVTKSVDFALPGR